MEQPIHTQHLADEELVDGFVTDVSALTKNNGAYFIRKTAIPDGTLKGRIMVELIPKSGFRFSDLPPELRNEIYRLVFEEQNAVRIITYPDHVCSRIWDATLQTWCLRSHRFALLRVSKQIHHEAAVIAYSCSGLSFYWHKDVQKFIEHAGPSLQFIQAIEISSQSFSGLPKLFRILREATSLRSLLLPSSIILKGVRKAAKGSQDPYKWATIFSRSVSSTLLALQEKYKADQRRWKVLDVLSFAKAGNYDSETYRSLSTDEIAANQKKIDDFMLAFRYVANAYLHEEVLEA